jgi:hypothetical protein
MANNMKILKLNVPFGAGGYSLVKTITKEKTTSFTQKYLTKRRHTI